MFKPNSSLPIAPSPTKEQKVQATTALLDQIAADNRVSFSMPSPEQKLVGALFDIHPDLGMWAYGLARSGATSDHIRYRLNGIVQEVEAERV